MNIVLYYLILVFSIAMPAVLVGAGILFFMLQKKIWCYEVPILYHSGDSLCYRFAKGREKARSGKVVIEIKGPKNKVTGLRKSFDKPSEDLILSKKNSNNRVVYVYEDLNGELRPVKLTNELPVKTVTEKLYFDAQGQPIIDEDSGKQKVVTSFEVANKHYPSAELLPIDGDMAIKRLQEEQYATEISKKPSFWKEYSSIIGLIICALIVGGTLLLLIVFVKDMLTTTVGQITSMVGTKVGEVLK